MNIGQMFLLGFDGSTLPPGYWMTEAVEQGLSGGVILFDRNVDGSVQNFSSPAQLLDLTAQLQEIAPDPLLIGVDQEGGRVCRLKEQDGFPATFSAAELGRDKGPNPLTASAGEAMATTLSKYGINLNLAPVADINLNPGNPIIARLDRSFSHDAEEIAAHCTAFIEAHHRRGVACCLKHFPGHGSACGDSHLGFVDITHDWQELELEPYKQLFKEGFTDAVMTAHVVHYSLDPTGLPATLSPAVVTGMLRKNLGFNGVIMTDDLQMKAISDRYGFREAVRLAVLAGADLMIVGNNLIRNPDALTQGIDVIKELLDHGEMERSRIQASLRRIAVLKEKIEGKRIW